MKSVYSPSPSHLALPVRTLCPFYAYAAPAEDIVAKQTLELQSLASSFRDYSIENVLEISNLGDEISRWGAIPDRAQTLIPQLCRFLSNINEVGVAYYRSWCCGCDYGYSLLFFTFLLLSLFLSS